MLHYTVYYVCDIILISFYYFKHQITFFNYIYQNSIFNFQKIYRLRIEEKPLELCFSECLLQLY